MKSTSIFIATVKGLMQYDISDQDHKPVALYFKGFSVNLFFIDPRNNRWWVGVAHKHWGQKLHYSDNEGKTWESTSLPKYDGRLLPDGKTARLRQIWCLQHGGVTRPDVLWMGTDPGGLFKSTDGGQTFHLVDSLWNHPSRSDLTQWFGAGSDHPFIHSIEVDPRDADHVYIAVSCAGIFETTDGGVQWRPKNNGLKAAYLPNPQAEVGHDPHSLKIHPIHSDILWQQNHCGIYYSKDQGSHWKDVSDPRGNPYYGFGLAVDDEDPAMAWVAPVESDENRIAPDLRLQIYKTTDYGASWVDDSKGLPSEFCFDIVLRHAMARKQGLFVIGTTNGNVYFRRSDHEPWQELARYLTKVNNVWIH
jgi:hypothetical protein